VVDRELVAVFLHDAEGVVAVREVKRDEVVSWARKVAQVIKRLARYVEVGAIDVGLWEVDNQTPLFGAELRE
jgi:hypothetical protein